MDEELVLLKFNNKELDELNPLISINPPLNQAKDTLSSSPKRSPLN